MHEDNLDGCLSATEFDREYAGKKPVLISHLVDAWPAHTSWGTKASFLERYGELKLQAITPLEYTHFSDVYGSAERATLDQVLSLSNLNSSLFVFDSKVVLERNSKGESMVDDFSVPLDWVGLANLAPALSVKTMPTAKYYTLSYGRDALGLGWHLHGPTWLATVVGVKR
jgi:hypothetical protein